MARGIQVVPGQYAGRSPGVVPVSFSLDKEALALARKNASTRKALGHYLARLIYEDEARRAERRRLMAVLQQGERVEE